MRSRKIHRYIAKMTSKQQLLRDRIVQFYTTHTKSETVKHFQEEGNAPSSIYNILSTYEDRGTTKRASGSGKVATIMTKRAVSKLTKKVNNSDKFSCRQLARTMGCSKTLICKTLRRTHIVCRKKQSSPAYTDAQIPEVKRCCRWMHDRYKKEDYVLDDEKYFTLSGPSNGNYYTSDVSTVPPELKFKQKSKFERKVLVYLAASRQGISKPFYGESGLAIDQNTYVDKCLKNHLVPFLMEHHADNNYIFWPDKASSHYSRKALDFLIGRNIRFVPKFYNPTNLPQCRPIEDLWGQLSTLVYQGGWQAKTLRQLKYRIGQSVKKLNLLSVQRSFTNIRGKLRVVYRKGPFSAVH